MYGEPLDGQIFQFTPLREGRHRECGKAGIQRNISIHAPPRGATGTHESFHHARTISIHAPPRGATSPFCNPGNRELFQFTPLREGRHLLSGTRYSACDFNSRPSARGDLTDGNRGNPNVFQFTPLREGRPDMPRTSSSVLFQFTPLREGRPDGSVILRRTPKVFQFTPLREGRLGGSQARRRLPFQFTPLREGRPFFGCGRSAISTFQFTPLREGRRDEAGGHVGRLQISIHAPPRGAT